MHKVIAGFSLIFIVACVLSSCHPGKKGIFDTRKSAHARYSENLEKAGLQNTVMANRWFLAAEKSLIEPVPVSLPFKEAGYFAADEPGATGYRLSAQRGVNLKVSLQVAPSTVKSVFLELWKIDTTAYDRDLMAEADSAFQLLYEIEEDGLYVIRLQPELLVGMEYTLTVTTQPSLAFPVSQGGKPVMISFWNDKRDEGRNHEGVDIRAPFRTPAIAAANGFIRTVTENRLGGKVVFLRPAGKNYTLYYAHLDSQLVSPGQDVLEGQPVGLIGTTGNAKNTTPHLHFGIYTRGGAVDPLPFIDNRVMQPNEITASRNYLNKWVRSTTKARILRMAHNNADSVSSVPVGEAIKILSVTAEWYRVQLADGRAGYVKSDVITDRSLKQITTDTITRMLDEPFTYAAAITTIPEGTNVTVTGATHQFYRVNFEKKPGWIEKRK